MAVRRKVTRHLGQHTDTLILATMLLPAGDNTRPNLFSTRAGTVAQTEH